MVESLEADQQEARTHISHLEEAERALGRGGIPSFVLEGTLGELQIK